MKATVLLVFLCLTIALFSAVINVPNDATTIQSGINVAADGDTVLVAPGLYYENLVFTNRDITLCSMYSCSLEPWLISKTILDGDEFDNVISIDADSDVSINGFTIKNGVAGIYSASQNVEISNCCIFENNSGIYFTDSGTSTIRNCTIADNWDYGIHINSSGAIDSNPIIINTVVFQNLIHGIYLTAVASDHAIVYPDISYSNISGGQAGVVLGDPIATTFSWLDGNINVDPLFINSIDDNYHLTATSQCIDSGNPECDCNPDDTNADMGAFFYPQTDINAGIVINEIMNNPSEVGDTDGEWIEIYNYGERTQNLVGWTIKDNDNDEELIIQSIPIKVGEFVVLGRNDDINANGGVEIDYEYHMGLSNSVDEVLLIAPSGATIDSLAYDNGATFPDPNGASMALLDPTLDNSIGGNWVTSTSSYGLGDLGTPGAPNFASPKNVAITITNDQVTLTWESIAGVSTYKVYSADSPDQILTEDLSGAFVNESWSTSATNRAHFYYVKAVIQ